MLNEQVDATNPSWKLVIENRRQRAEYYFDTVLNKQREWYSTKAGQQKNRHLLLAVTVIVLGALISVLQIFSEYAGVSIATAVLGAAVTIGRAMDGLLRPDEAWQAYRKASENMKREYRLYLNGADSYATISDEDAGYRLLVERVETIIAEEQQLFWQFHAKTPPQPSSKIKPDGNPVTP
ncbi:conserved hypothetical protein [Gammaproteobacteria bacterium]